MSMGSAGHFACTQNNNTAGTHTVASSLHTGTQAGPASDMLVCYPLFGKALRQPGLTSDHHQEIAGPSIEKIPLSFSELSSGVVTRQKGI
jgi:hypothetical protein